jgi:hypothetical protein
MIREIILASRDGPSLFGVRGEEVVVMGSG